MKHDKNDAHVFGLDSDKLDFIVSFIQNFGVDREKYRDLASQIATTMKFDEIRTKRIIDAGIFDLSDLFAYIYKTRPNENHSRPTGFITHFVNRMKQHGVIFDNKYDDVSAGDKQNYIQLNASVIRQYVEWNCLDNTFSGISQLMKKYSKSIFHITVTNVKSDQNGQKGTYSGSGFAIKILDHTGKRRLFAITNKHVVEPGVWEVSNIVDGQRADVKFKNVTCSAKYDLAAIELDPTDDCSLTAFAVSPTSYLLEDIVVVGYPVIPRACDAVQLVQSGEINGSTRTYDGEDLMIMSVPVSPGASGGPVLNSLGLVVGVTVQSNEGDYPRGRSVHYCAVPWFCLSDFVTKEIRNRINPE